MTRGTNFTALFSSREEQGGTKKSVNFKYVTTKKSRRVPKVESEKQKRKLMDINVLFGGRKVGASVPSFGFPSVASLKKPVFLELKSAGTLKRQDLEKENVEDFVGAVEIQDLEKNDGKSKKVKLELKPKKIKNTKDDMKIKSVAKQGKSKSVEKNTKAEEDDPVKLLTKNPLSFYKTLSPDLNTEQKLLEIVDYTLRYLEKKEPETKRIVRDIRTQVLSTDLDEKPKIPELESQIAQWKTIKAKVLKNNTLTLHKPKEKRIEPERIETTTFEFKKNQVINQCVQIRKFVRNAKTKCEELFRKIFNTVNNTPDPLAIMKALSKLTVN